MFRANIYVNVEKLLCFIVDIPAGYWFLYNSLILLILDWNLLLDNSLCTDLDFLHLLDLDWNFFKGEHSQILIYTKLGLSPSKNKMLYLLQWKPLENDEKCFLFHLKSSFGFQDIYVFVLTFCSCRKTAWLER